MDTTAGQIASYTGNAGAALGSAPAGTSGATSIYGGGDLSSTERAMDAIALHSFQKNKMEYERKIRERDEIKQAVFDEKMDIGRLLPKDREYITKNFRDPLHKMLLENPNITKDSAKYQELLTVMDKFREAKAYGSARLAVLSGLDKEIAAELDPEKRKRMIDHRNAMEAQDIYADVKPYQQTLDYDDGTFVNPAPIVSTDEVLVGDKLVKKTKTYTPLKDFVQLPLTNYIDSPNKTLKNQMDQFANSFKELSPDLKVEKVAQWNRKIAEVMEQEGVKPGDPLYIKPIKGQMLQGGYLVTSGVEELIRAESLLRNYKNTLSDEEKPTKMGAEIRKLDSETKKNLAEAKFKIPAEVAELYAKAAKARAETAKTQQEAKDLRDKAAENDGQGDFYVQSVASAYDPSRYQGFPTMDAGGNVKLPDGKNWNVPLKDQAGTKVVHFRGEDGKYASGLSEVELNALALRETYDGKLTITKPEFVMYNYNNTKDPHFVVRYAIPLEGGKVKYEVRKVSPNRFVETSIKNIVGDNTTGAENKDYKLLMKRYRELTGSENINGTIMSVIESDLMKSKGSLAEDVDNAFD